MAAMYLLGLFIESVVSINFIPENDIEMIWKSIIKNISPDEMTSSEFAAKALVRLAPATAITFQDK